MSAVRFTQERGLGVLTLDNPPLNLIGQALIDDLLAAIDQIEASEGPAEVLAEWGVGDRALPADDLHDAAAAFVGSLANGPSEALAVVKRLARVYEYEGVPGADGLLLDAAVPLFDTEDARAGIETFLTTGKTRWP